MLEEIVNQVVAKSVEYCSKEENVQRLEETFLSPIIQHISRKFAWLSYSFQTVTVLVVIQTFLLLYLIYLVRSMPTASTA
jgi:hypothetical protein